MRVEPQGWKKQKFLDFPEMEYRDRLERVRAEMKKSGIDGAVVTQKESVVYFTGFRTDLLDSKYWTQGMGVVLSLDYDPVLFTTTVDYGCAHTLCWMGADSIRQWSPAGKERGFEFSTGEGLILSILGELRLTESCIGFELGLGTRMSMPYDQFQRILHALPKARISDASDAVMKTRGIKSPLEIERIRAACHATDLGIDAVWHTLRHGWRTGVTQIELERQCSMAMAEAGGVLLFFNCWSGPPYMDMSNGASLPIKVKRGDIVNLDLGAKLNWYVSDFMRIAFVGGPPKEEWARMVSLVRKAQLACIDLMKPGADGGACWKACEDVIRGSQYWEDFIGGGHGIGMELHELPRINTAGPLEPGMVTTVEPAIFPARRLNGAPGAPGFWLEEVVAITETGHEVLSAYDPEPYVIL
jgi:Xaa-Pro aminopeptidase